MTSEAILSNISYLTEHLTNISSVLNRLESENIISSHERESVLAENVTIDQNSRLFILLHRKDWHIIEEVTLKILILTGNKNCANRILGIPSRPLDSYVTALGNKWWPEEKKLSKAFIDRTIGNDVLVEVLYASLTADDSLVGQTVAITGLGGVGKSTLAIRYADYYKELYDYIVWIDCGGDKYWNPSEDNLWTPFKYLATDLGIAPEAYNLKRLVKMVYERLSEFQSSCLIIFDNATEYTNGIKDVLPETGKYKFHCLVTSRNRSWGFDTGHGEVKQFPLDVFRSEESVEFLKNNLTIPFDNGELVSLARLLGNLPLALQIALAKLNRVGDGMTVEEYIRRLSEADAIIEPNFKVDDYEKTINKTMQISFEVIRKEGECGKIAMDILQIFAYLRPDGIELQMFADVLAVKVEQVEEAADILENYSLITNNGIVSKEVAAPLTWGKVIFQLFDCGCVAKRLSNTISKTMVEFRMVSMHRLVQQVLRYNCKTDKKSILMKILKSKASVANKIVPYVHAERIKNLGCFLGFRRWEMFCCHNGYEKIEGLIDAGRFDEAVELSKLGYPYNLHYNSQTWLIFSIFTYFFLYFVPILFIFHFYLIIYNHINGINGQNVSAIMISVNQMLAYFPGILLYIGMRASQRKRHAYEFRLAMCFKKVGQTKTSLRLFKNLYKYKYIEKIGNFGWCTEKIRPAKATAELNLSISGSPNKFTLSFWIVFLESQLGIEFKKIAKEPLAVIKKLELIKIRGNELSGNENVFNLLNSINVQWELIGTGSVDPPSVGVNTSMTDEGEFVEVQVI